MTAGEMTDRREASPLSAILRTETGLLVGRIMVFALLLLGWQFASGTLVPAFWISDPVRILGRLWTWAVSGSLWPHIYATIVTTSLGYAIGGGLGIALGLMLGVMRRLERVIAPLIAALFCLPKIALLPLFVIAFGIDIESKVALVSVVVVFLTLYSTIDGVRDVDPDLIDALKLMGAGRDEILLKVILPSTLPWIYNGLRVAISYALATAVVGELLSSNRGIGFLIESSAARFDSTGVFAAVLVLVALSVLVTETLTGLERRATRHRGSAV